jgi:hypothetical protein
MEGIANMARPWKLVMYLPTQLHADTEGRESDLVTGDTFVGTAMRTLERSYEYRLSFDRDLGLWAVYVRANGSASG